MKILNLYAGIGGNRKLWGDKHKIVAVENNKEIAKIYQDFFPKDKIIVGDAHRYLLDHYEEFDFIWSSPPCTTHSSIRRMGVQVEQYKAVYPDMELYQEIILLRQFSKCKWVVENVKPYYQPLILANELHRHLFWSNFNITRFDNLDERTKHNDITGKSTVYGFNLEKYKTHIRKDKILRNMVNPNIGLHILKCAFPQEVNLPKGFIRQEAIFNI